ncbi:MAG: RNA polymerase sigma factor [Methyloligella sp.]|jgi:RNA polymerase sigma-70 factor (ECF subfamily)|nr:MAG: RNA polymerase sigma factor [Methyloligella sp.]
MRSKINKKALFNEQSSDKDLICYLSEGHEAALNQLMARYKIKLFSFIFKYVRNEDVAYDLLQETFIRVYTKANTYNPKFTFSTWIYQIAMNLCRDWGRKQKIRNFISLNAYVSPDSSKSIEETIEDPTVNIENLIDSRDQLRALEKEMQNLPHKLKTALVLFTIEDHSQEECAKLLNVTPKTIETRVYRARKILSEKLSNLF